MTERRLSNIIVIYSLYFKVDHKENELVISILLKLIVFYLIRLRKAFLVRSLVKIGKAGGER